MAGRLTGRQKSSTLAQSASRGGSKDRADVLGRKRLLPHGLSDADADAGIAGIVAGAAALPFNLRSFA
jgi:hypothetical protein